MSILRIMTLIFAVVCYLMFFITVVANVLSTLQAMRSRDYDSDDEKRTRRVKIKLLVAGLINLIVGTLLFYMYNNAF